MTKYCVPACIVLIASVGLYVFTSNWIGLSTKRKRYDCVCEDRKMAIAHENVKGRDVNPDEMWELSPHHVHNKYIKRKTDSVCCSTPLSVFHSLLIFS